MIKNKTEGYKTYLDTRSASDGKNVCDLSYLTETMGGKKHLIKELMDTFLIQVPQDLSSLNGAVKEADYPSIKNFTHSLKSSVSIMGISALGPVLIEIGELAVGATDIERINKLNDQLNSICVQAIGEISEQRRDYT